MGNTGRIWWLPLL